MNDHDSERLVSLARELKDELANLAGLAFHDPRVRRERIATAVLQGLLSHSSVPVDGPDTEAGNAVRYADALIAALGATADKEPA